jgi:hypothetical protein
MKINSAKELREYFNKEFGINKEWPRTFYVNSETYADCCQEVFDWHIITQKHHRIANLDSEPYHKIELSLGLNNGLKFKNVELLLDRAM